MEPHLKKIKLLLNLATSSNENEAASARERAQKLIDKFQVSPEELEKLSLDETPIYTDENLLLEIEDFSDWMATLALIVAKKYDCHAIQERILLTTGATVYKFFIYGEDGDVEIGKMLYSYVFDKINEVINSTNNDDSLYRSSFGEGAVDGVRNNIQYENFNVNKIVKVAVEDDTVHKVDAIAIADKGPKPPPAIEKRTNLSENEKPINIMAYFKGVKAGESIHLNSSEYNVKDLDMLEVFEDETLY
jgi:hypothetical protein